MNKTIRNIIIFSVVALLAVGSAFSLARLQSSKPKANLWGWAWACSCDKNK